VNHFLVWIAWSNHPKRVAKLENNHPEKYTDVWDCLVQIAEPITQNVCLKKKIKTPQIFLSCFGLWKLEQVKKWFTPTHSELKDTTIFFLKSWMKTPSLLSWADFVIELRKNSKFARLLCSIKKKAKLPKIKSPVLFWMHFC